MPNKPEINPWNVPLPLEDGQWASLVWIAMGDVWTSLKRWITIVGYPQALALYDAGLVEVWTHTSEGIPLSFTQKNDRGQPVRWEPYVSLTVLGAHRLCVDVDERGSNEDIEWGDVWATAEARGEPIVLDSFERHFREPFPEDAVDRAMSPLEEAAFNEALANHAAEQRAIKAAKSKVVIDLETGEPLILLGRQVAVNEGLGRPKRAG